MRRIYSSFPIVTCPHCECEFQVDDYYEMDIGDSFECHKCEKEIFILFKDIVIEVELGTELI